MDRLNLSSPEARTRIGLRVNDRYRRITSSIGLITTRRLIDSVTIDPTDIDSTLPDYTVDDLEKILKVTLMTSADTPRTLREVTYDELTNVGTNDALPRVWAVKRVGSHEVTITFDGFPATDTFDVKFEGYELSTVLADDAEPVFPEDFHDILVEGAMSDELRKMEKAPLAQMAEAKYEQRLSDLRMFIAKSAYLDIVQGKDKPGYLWYQRWFTRTGIFD